MSDEEMVNDHMVLISGESGTGKSASLRNMRDPNKIMYLNCEAGKKLPFRSKFQEFRVLDPLQVPEGLKYAKGHPEEIKGVIIDTLTFLMDMFESQYVLGSTDTLKGWSNYAQFFKNMMQIDIAALDVPVIVLGHTNSEFNESQGRYDVNVPVKGALKKNGIEAYFSTVVSAKKVTIKELKEISYDPELLTITEAEEAIGYKHVFQTSLNKKTIGERIRAPMGLWEPNQIYINNDAQLLMDHMKKFYA